MDKIDFCFEELKFHQMIALIVLLFLTEPSSWDNLVHGIYSPAHYIFVNRKKKKTQKQLSLPSRDSSALLFFSLAICQLWLFAAI